MFHSKKNKVAFSVFIVKMSKRQLSQYYLTIYSTVFDAGGNFLAAGNNHGTIAVFNLVSIFETNEDDDPVEELDKPTKDPFYQFQAHRQAVYSMVSTGKVVVSGSVGEIRAWNWVSLKTRDYRRMWTLKLEPSDNFVKLEVNALALSVEDSNKVYAGCGDNVVYCIDVEKGKTLLSLRGHTDYVHCVIANDANKCISGSEDGSVRLWDTRGGREMASFEPYKHEAVRRPEIGKWIGCVAVDSTNEWLVCGGGPSLYMWNLPTLSPLILMPKEDIIPSVVRFCGDSIVSGGSEPRLNFWSFNGRLTNVIKVPPSHVFGIGIGHIEDRELLSISGCSYKIEVFNTSRDHECTLMFTV